MFWCLTPTLAVFQIYRGKTVGLMVYSFIYIYTGIVTIWWPKKTENTITVTVPQLNQLLEYNTYEIVKLYKTCQENIYFLFSATKDIEASNKIKINKPPHGVIVGVFASSMVDHGFNQSWSGQTKDNTIVICCLSAKQAALRSMVGSESISSIGFLFWLCYIV